MTSKMMNRKPNDPENFRNQKRYSLIKIWLMSFLVPVLVIVSVLTIFKDVVGASIQNTSFPALVYLIFGSFLLGLLLSAIALLRYQKELKLLRYWFVLENNYDKRNWILDNIAFEKYHVYSVLRVISQSLSATEKQAKFEHEIRIVETGLSEKLMFPNFIAGSLVGLGLVGTFVGLLGTLQELGAVFGALSSTGDTGANPTAVFSDMVQKLQDPMRGMGTAFVTSLYGLLGSLILGFTSLSIARMTSVIVNELYRAERDFIVYDEKKKNPIATADPQSSSLINDLVGNLSLISAQFEQNSVLIKEAVEGLDNKFERVLSKSSEYQEITFGRMLEHINNNNQQMFEYLDSFKNHNNQISNVLFEEQAQLNSTVELIANQISTDKDKVYRELINLVDNKNDDTNRRLADLEINLSKIVKLNEMSSRNIDRFIKHQEENASVLPNTPYWREAWFKVQKYLNKSKADHDLDKLANSIGKQTMTMNRLVDQLTHLAWLESKNANKRDHID